MSDVVQIKLDPQDNNIYSAMTIRLTNGFKEF